MVKANVTKALRLSAFTYLLPATFGCGCSGAAGRNQMGGTPPGTAGAAGARGSSGGQVGAAATGGGAEKTTAVGRAGAAAGDA
jgi:hypothetical protein